MATMVFSNYKTNPRDRTEI